MKKVLAIRTVVSRVEATPSAPSRRNFANARLIGVFGVAALTLSIGVATSRAGHSTTGGPVPVSITGTPYVSLADNGALQPFAKRISSLTPTGSTTFTVPAGKELVITDVSSEAFGDVDSSAIRDILLTTTVGGTLTNRQVPFVSTINGLEFATATINDYADPGSTVTVVLDDPVSTDSVEADVDIKGYYVNVP